MATTNKLTDAKLRALKPTGRAQKIFDGEGLYLHLMANGSRIWRMAYRMHAADQTATFGPYPDVSLAKAREKRAALKDTLRDGGDPRIDRTEGIPTVAEMIEGYWAQRQDITDVYRAGVLACMKAWIYPKLGRRLCNRVEEEDVMAALLPINEKGKFETVRRARGWLDQAFDYARAHKWCRHNPVSGINPRRAFGQRTVQHFASLKLSEVPEFMQRLAAEKDNLSALACRFIAYTWVRTKEARAARFDDIRDGLWEIDASTMKRRKEHLVPLPRQAQAIVELLAARCLGSEFLFPGWGRKDRPISEATVLTLIHRMGYQGRMTTHGWRSVASTWANEAGWSPDAIERQLAHSPNDKVRSAYNRAAYLDERRRMMQAWADWLDQQEGVEPAGRQSTV